MKLTRHQQEMLDGKHGEAKQYCMKKMYDFGIAVEAEEMVPVSLIINACPIYLEDLTDPDLAVYDMGHSPLYLPIFRAKDGKTVSEEPQCHPCNDPFLLQIDKYEEEGYPWNFSWGSGRYKIPQHIYEAYARGYKELQKHGWINTCSCQTQMNMCPPKFGEYCASSESSCAAYINSIIGGRTNRENSITSVYAAYTGCIPKYGTMLDENRRARVIVKLTDEVRDSMSDPADWAALGAVIAEKGGNRIPAVLNLPRMISNTAAKYITGCVSPGMNDPMLHLIGLSPESPTLEAAFGGRIPRDVEKYEVTLEDVKEEYRFLNSISPAKSDKVDIVIMGCPLLTYDEVRQIARLIEGKKVNGNVYLWVQTDVSSYYLAHEFGEAKVIEDAGGKIYHSTCMAMNPMRIWSHDLTIATDSFKYVKLAGGYGQKWIYGSVPDLINAAVTGKFVSTRW
ncbi:MAG: aconitase X [candidate division WOR-3 bacterium]